MKLISVVTPCYNEEDNVRELCGRIKTAFAALPGYDYEHICIDNASKDRTVEILRELAEGVLIEVAGKEWAALALSSSAAPAGYAVQTRAAVEKKLQEELPGLNEALKEFD